MNIQLQGSKSKSQTEWRKVACYSTKGVHIVWGHHPCLPHVWGCAGGGWLCCIEMGVMAGACNSRCFKGFVTFRRARHALCQLCRRRRNAISPPLGSLKLGGSMRTRICVSAQKCNGRLARIHADFTCAYAGFSSGGARSSLRAPVRCRRYPRLHAILAWKPRLVPWRGSTKVGSSKVSSTTVGSL